MLPDNYIVNSLWIGKQLSELELLTINSFLNNGHQFILWTYDDIITPLPDALIVRNAGEIIPKDKVFQYRFKNQFDHGKGSYAGFSDIFRYKLLYEYGGWWVDMDVTCLKPFHFKTPYVFRTHHDLKMVGNIMKCPPKSDLMKLCYEKASSQVTAYNRDWNKPIRILNDTILQLDLSEYILEFSNRDSWDVVRKFISSDAEVPCSWFAIHWVNEEWRRNKIDKSYSGKESLLRKLLIKNGVPPGTLPKIRHLTNAWRLTVFSFPFRYVYSLKYLPKYAWNKYGTFLWGYVDYYIKKYSKKA